MMENGEIKRSKDLTKWLPTIKWYKYQKPGHMCGNFLTA